MADASGLNAAQAEANAIPYRNIALGNPAEKFLNAWAVATGLRLKQSEVEGKMQQLALKNQQMENESVLNEKKFGLMKEHLEFDKDKAYKQLDLTDQLRQIERANSDARIDEIRRKADKADQIKNDTIGWNEYMSRSGAPAGSEEYRLLARQGLGIYPLAAVNLATINKENQAVRDNVEKGIQAEQDLLMKKVGEDYNLPGGPAYRNTSPFLNTEKWLNTFDTEPSEAEKAQGKTPLPAVSGATTRTDAATGMSTPVKWKKDANGNLIPNDNLAMYVMPTTPGTEGSWSYIPKDAVANVHQKLVDINKRMAALPPKDAFMKDTHGGAIRIYNNDEYRRAPTNVPLYFVDPVTQQETWYKPKEQ